MAIRDARRRLLIPALMALAAGAIGAAEPVPIARAVGQRMANFTLKNTEGTPVTLYGFRGKRAVVLAFTVTSAVAVTGTPWLLVALYLAHGAKDLWQHRTGFVRGTRWWPPFCFAVDVTVAAIVAAQILAGVEFH